MWVCVWVCVCVCMKDANHRNTQTTIISNQLKSKQIKTTATSSWPTLFKLYQGSGWSTKTHANAPFGSIQCQINWHYHLLRSSSYLPGSESLTYSFWGLNGFQSFFWASRNDRWQSCAGGIWVGGAIMLFLTRMAPPNEQRKTRNLLRVDESWTTGREKKKHPPKRKKTPPETESWRWTPERRFWTWKSSHSSCMLLNSSRREVFNLSASKEQQKILWNWCPGLRLLLFSSSYRRCS